MFPARKDAGRRRGRLPLAAGVVAFGAGAAGVLITAPAQADTPPIQPSANAVAHPKAPSQAELRARVKAAAKADPSLTAAADSAQKGNTSASSSSSTASPMIIGGQTTTLSTAPWMAQLWYYDPAAGEGFFCGGTVVSPTKILTAAHCVAGYDWYDNGAVVTGTNQLVADDGSTDGDVTAVDFQWSSPGYSDSAYGNDVAVLTLDTPVTARPLRVAMGDDTADYTAGTTGTVYGWGRTSSTTQDLSPTLKKASLPIVGDSACSGFFGPDYDPSSGMFCAGTPATGSDTGTTSPCNGDSGGPLVVNNTIVGVVSWGATDCVAEGAYAVFSKVSTFAGQIVPQVYAAVFNRDGSIDNKADMGAVTSGGDAYFYQSKGTDFLPRRLAWTGVTGATMLRESNLNSDNGMDMLVRDSWGNLFSLDIFGNQKLVGTSWNSMKGTVTPGDLTGDPWPDVFAATTTGTAYLYAGTANAKLGTRFKIGTGWDAYKGDFYGMNDLSGDGRPDIVARDTHGVLWLYEGTGKATAPFKPRVRIGSGWNAYNQMDAFGDMTGDGHADLVARDSHGVLWLYKGTGKASAPYAPRVEIGSGWNAYKLIG
jgi:hypothetical protein